MKTIAIIYGSTTGNTEKVAKIIQSNLEESKVIIAKVSEAKEEMVTSADLVLLGASTWGYGEIQDDFISYYESMNSEIFKGKNVAAFGCGDKEGFPDVFCQAVDLINEKASALGANVLVEGLKIDGDVDDHVDEINSFVKRVQ